MIFSKASGVNDSVFGKSQDPIKMFLEKMDESFEGRSQLKNIYYMDKTNQYGEKYSSLTAMGDFEITDEGGQYPRTSMQVGFEKFIEPEEWKNSFVITQTMLEDGKLLRHVKTEGTKFVNSWHRTREKFGATLLANGISTTMKFGARTLDIAGADGQPLFYHEHPSKTKRAKLKQSNLFGDEFSYDALSYVEEAMQKFKDDEGNLLNINPQTIIIPNDAAIKRDVFQVLNAEGKPGGDFNDGNFQLGRWNVIVWNELSQYTPTGLTSGKSWWIVADMDANEVYEGLIWLERIPLAVRSWIDNNTDNNIFNGRGRYGAAPNNWRPWAACIPGAANAVTLVPNGG